MEVSQYYNFSKINVKLKSLSYTLHRVLLRNELLFAHNHTHTHAHVHTHTHTQVSAFGEGTYLSTDLGVCLNWSPSGALWPKSLLAPTASCVAVCEVVKHPSVM